MTTRHRVILASLSAAMDGGFIAIADISAAMEEIGATENHRLIGGVAVMLHIQRLGLDLPLRATGDADFGVPPHLLEQSALVPAIEALGYEKVVGNRWERRIDDRRVAAVDLLIPAYTSRPRHTKRVGGVVTTEVPGLAAALRRPGTSVDAELRLATGAIREARIMLPDALATLELKARVRKVRDEERDAQDLWRCREIAANDGVTPELVDAEGGAGLREMLYQELGVGGASLSAVSRGLQDNAAARLRTRIRSLLADVIGTV
ncbi:MAG: hypothetical protein MUP67_05915 [Acidimicrobiia bacterium]|nr:hypothetical protein [Acidimicrobiia bacterium]